MARTAGDNQKLKFLIMADIFLKNTNEQNPISIYELSEVLETMGVNANRKTLSEDIDLLRQYGMDIITVPMGKMNGYYIGSRDFELTELKLLADAVSSARFITEKKSRQLISKLETLCDQYSVNELKRNVFIADRVKADNEMIYLNVDAINRAIRNRCMINFSYYKYSAAKKKIYSEKEHICAPYGLTWSDGNYYMIAYYEGRPDNLTNFRIDRMEKVTLMPEKKYTIPRSFSLSEYMSTSFSMFSAGEVNVTMRFSEEIANAVIDKFGKERIFIPDGEGYFRLNTDIKPGPSFYSWIFQFGNKAEIISPKIIRDKFTDMCSEMLTMYSGGKT